MNSHRSFVRRNVLIFTFFLVLELGTEMKIDPNPLWYGISGLLLGLGVVIPGMSGSAPLTFLGLYEALTELISGVAEAGIGMLTGKLSFVSGLEAMSLQNVIPVGIGILFPFVVLSRPIHFCIRKFPSQMYHTIFGVVLATTIPTLIFKIGFGVLPVAKIGFLILGFICAWLFDRVSRKYT